MDQAFSVIRQATLQDATELARLRWEFSPDEVQAGLQPWVEYARAFAGFLEQALASGRWVIWVIEDEGAQPCAPAAPPRLLGNLYVQLVAKVPRPGRFHGYWGYVTNVYVMPEARNRGLGSQLLQCAVTWARTEGLQFLLVWPSTESVHFYERAGFVHSAEALELPLKDWAARHLERTREGSESLRTEIPRPEYRPPYDSLSDLTLGGQENG